MDCSSTRAESRPAESDSPPLCVDLDGTLIRTDTLWESVILLLRKKPLDAAFMPMWLLGGKAAFKAQVAARVTLSPGALPYHEGVLELLAAERARGRRIVLVTAANEKIASSVADHLNIFDEVIATTDTRNLRGAEKLNALRTRFAGGFDYIGDSAADLPVLAAAREAMLVNPSATTQRKAEAAGNLTRTIADKGSPLPLMIRAMRPHQWAKNVLLAVPLVTAHRIMDFEAVWSVVLAMIAFSLIASGTYILNDLFDLRADRLHPHKCKRPFASGRLSIKTGIVMSAVLVSAGGAIAALTMSGTFIAYMALYVAVTIGYSLVFKAWMLLDVFVLAGFYTLRIMAGAAAIPVEVSPWLLAFSLFFFLSLAFAKRYAELSARDESEEGRLPGRRYERADMDIVRVIGPTNGYLAVLVFTLYIYSPEVRELYSRPDILWWTCPILIYWVTRVWFLANRRELHHDPVVFALTDAQSYFVGSLLAIVLILATLLGAPA